MRALVLVSCLCALAAAGPIITIHKTATEVNALVGSDVTFTTVAVNIGDEAAQDFVLEDGEVEKVDLLGPGENVTITSVVQAANLGQLDVAQATATWAHPTDASARFRATSNQLREEERDEKRHAQSVGPRGFINVVSATEYDRLNSRFIKETFLYVLLSIVIVGFPFAMYRQKQVQVEFHLKECRKK